jgi:hypothetical protein
MLICCNKEVNLRLNQKSDDKTEKYKCLQFLSYFLSSIIFYIFHPNRKSSQKYPNINYDQQGPSINYEILGLKPHLLQNRPTLLPFLLIKGEQIAIYFI